MLHLATATYNFKWVKNTHISLIWDQQIGIADFETSILIPVT